MAKKESIYIEEKINRKKCQGQKENKNNLKKISIWKKKNAKRRLLL